MLLPLVGEPVEVLVPCGGSDLKFVKIFKIFKIFKILKTLKVFKTEDLKTLNLRIQYDKLKPPTDPDLRPAPLSPPQNRS